MSESDAPQEFKVRQPINETFNAGAVSALVGLAVSAVQNSLQKHKAGAMGVFTRTGSTIALFTLVGGAFAYADAMVANYRQKEDGWNGASGGCAAGLVMGAASMYTKEKSHIPARSMPAMAGSCVGLGALVGTFQAAGNSLLNQAGIRPSVGEDKPDAESPLSIFAQERRQRFFKKPASE